jgi:hypothetical protein
MDRDVLGVFSDGSDHVGASTLTQECIMIDRDRALTFCGVHKITYWSMVENGNGFIQFRIRMTYWSKMERDPFHFIDQNEELTTDHNIDNDAQLRRGPRERCHRFPYCGQ